MVSEPGYIPPRGSLDIPHRRTAADILFRTVFINGAAFLACHHLVRLLEQRRHPQKLLPVARYSLPLFAILLPELLPIQLGFRLIQECIAKRRAVSEFSDENAVKEERSVSGHNGRELMRWAAKHIALVAANLIPLWAAIQGYRERLAMRYHEATYVGNLNLDHRNGWAAFAGVMAAAVSMLTILHALTFGHTTSPQENGHTRAKSLEGETSGLYDSSFDAPLQSKDSSRLVHILNSLPSFDISTRLQILLAALIHQIPLLATNRLTPFELLNQHKGWLLLIILLFLFSWILTLYIDSRHHDRNLAVSRNRFLADLFTFVYNIIFVSTIVTQACSDVGELYDVTHGRLMPWNYRWQVKDRFSTGDNDRVYMG